jgi:hypothetical protein
MFYKLVVPFLLIAVTLTHGKEVDDNFVAGPTIQPWIRPEKPFVPLTIGGASLPFVYQPMFDLNKYGNSVNYDPAEGFGFF